MMRSLLGTVSSGYVGIEQITIIQTFYFPFGVDKRSSEDNDFVSIGTGGVGKSRARCISDFHFNPG